MSEHETPDLCIERRRVVLKKTQKTVGGTILETWRVLSRLDYSRSMRRDEEEEVLGKTGGELVPLVGEAPPVDAAGIRRRCGIGGVEAPSMERRIGVENFEVEM